MQVKSAQSTARLTSHLDDGLVNGKLAASARVNTVAATNLQDSANDPSGRVYLSMQPSTNASSPSAVIKNASAVKIQEPVNSKLDRLGVWVTSLCALHCMLLPILIPLVPLVASSFVAAEWFERSILSFSILVGFAALFIGFHKYHRQLYPMYSLVLGALIYWNKHMFGEAFEPLTIAVGALFIIGAHIANLRLCKKCKQCETC